MTDLQRAIDATANAIPTMSARQLHEALVTAQETIDALVRRVAELGCELAESQKQVAAWHAVADRRTMQVEHERGRADELEAENEALGNQFDTMNASLLETEKSRERLSAFAKAYTDEKLGDGEWIAVTMAWTALDMPRDLEPLLITTSSTGPSMAEMGPPMTALADALLWREARASVALSHDSEGQTMVAGDNEEVGQ